MNQARQLRNIAAEPAGYDIEEWCKQAGIGRTTEHKLEPSQKPNSVRIGRRRRILEAPRTWLLRMQSIQQEEA